MKIFVLTLVLLAAHLTSTGATAVRQANVSDQEIASLVNQLSWESVGGECNGVWRIFPTGIAANRLIQIGKRATSQLVQVLKDQEKGVAAHLVLTAIWEPERIRIENSIEGNEFEFAYHIHVYNGLRWTDVIDFKSLSVTSKVNKTDLARNAEKWRLRLSTKSVYRGNITGNL
jgi:hypothetical protein